MFILSQDKKVVVNMDLMRDLRQREDKIIAVYNEIGDEFEGYILGQYRGDLHREEIINDILKKAELGRETYLMPEE